MTITRIIALLRAEGFTIRRSRVRVNGHTAYRVQFPGEPLPRHCYYGREDLLALVMR